jgi:hypothetical protein
MIPVHLEQECFEAFHRQLKKASARGKPQNTFCFSGSAASFFLFLLKLSSNQFIAAKIQRIWMIY